MRRTINLNDDTTYEVKSGMLILREHFDQTLIIANSPEPLAEFIAALTQPQKDLANEHPGM